MNALCRAYENTADAERAVEALLAAGVPGDDVRLLMSVEMYDARRAAKGRFDGATGAQDRVGAFAGGGERADAPRGSYAAGRGAGREGVFADADRDMVVTFSDGREHSRVAGHRRLKRLLVDAGLEDGVANADVRALHDGRVLVLVTTEDISDARAAEVLDAVVA